MGYCKLVGAVKLLLLKRLNPISLHFCNNRICINSFAFNEVFVNVGLSS